MEGKVWGGHDLRKLTKGYLGATASFVPLLGQGGGRLPGSERKMGSDSVRKIKSSCFAHVLLSSCLMQPQGAMRLFIILNIRGAEPEVHCSMLGVARKW